MKKFIIFFVGGLLSSFSGHALVMNNALGMMGGFGNGMMGGFGNGMMGGFGNGMMGGFGNGMMGGFGNGMMGGFGNGMMGGFGNGMMGWGGNSWFSDLWKTTDRPECEDSRPQAGKRKQSMMQANDEEDPDSLREFYQDASTLSMSPKSIVISKNKENSRKTVTEIGLFRGTEDYVIHLIVLNSTTKDTQNRRNSEELYEELHDLIRRGQISYRQAKFMLEEQIGILQEALNDLNKARAFGGRVSMGSDYVWLKDAHVNRSQRYSIKAREIKNRVKMTIQGLTDVKNRLNNMFGVPARVDDDEDIIDEENVEEENEEEIEERPQPRKKNGSSSQQPASKRSKMEAD